MNNKNKLNTYSFNPSNRIKELSKKLIKENKKLLKRLEDA